MRISGYLRAWTVGARLALGFAVVLAMLVAAAAAGEWGLASLHRMSADALTKDVDLARRSARIGALVLTERRFEKDAFINVADVEKRESYIRKWTSVRDALGNALAEAQALPFLDETDRQSFAAIARALGIYAAGFEATIASIREGKLADAPAANAEFDKYKTAVHDMETASDAINERAAEGVATLPGRLARTHDVASAWQLAIAAACVVAGLALCVAISRSITRQLGGEPADVIRLAHRIAQGDLTPRPEIGQAEPDSLVDGMDRMLRSLRHIVGAVRAGSDCIAMGSTRIARDGSGLSQRTEVQASSLQQAAASVEQLGAMVRHNADTALDAERLASSASAVAGHGGELVGRVVATMDDISGSSRKVADIVAVIDGIAFQTNILALNAAVEAARAGDHGRGFAVVAGEVRALAQRCTGAAREIKRLIGASVERVEAGHQLVGEAGRTMAEVVGRMNEVAALVSTISAATAGQIAGIAQVGTVVVQLDRVTQQNAALVEESAAAANSLRQEADRLVESVGVFRLEHALQG